VNGILVNIDLDLAGQVARHLGIEPPREGTVEVPESELQRSPALSQQTLLPEDVRGKKVAILVFDGVTDNHLQETLDLLARHGIHSMLLGPTSAPVVSAGKQSIEVGGMIKGEPSIAFDAVLVPDGSDVVTCVLGSGDAKHYLYEAYKHLKTIVLMGTAARLAEELSLEADAGLMSAPSLSVLEQDFIAALKAHRAWSREPAAQAVPA
jgi:catalase